jgi:hypothetical protein
MRGHRHKTAIHKTTAYISFEADYESLKKLVAVQIAKRSDLLQLLLEFRNIALDPSKDSCMSQVNAALGHHFAQITVTVLVGYIPALSQNDY